MENNYVALSAGTEFIIDTINDKSELEYLEGTVKKSGLYVRVYDTIYPVYKGVTFWDSQQIDKLIDSGEYEIFKTNQHLVEFDIK